MKGIMKAFQKNNRNWCSTKASERVTMNFTEYTRRRSVTSERILTRQLRPRWVEFGLCWRILRRAWEQQFNSWVTENLAALFRISATNFSPKSKCEWTLFEVAWHFRVLHKWVQINQFLKHSDIQQTCILKVCSAASKDCSCYHTMQKQKISRTSNRSTTIISELLILVISLTHCSLGK